MAIPKFQKVLLPFLKFTSDEQKHKLKEAIEVLSKVFELNDEELKEKVPSGYATIFVNRVAWSRTYLKKAGLIEYPERGYFKITKRGKEVLEQNLEEIDAKFLKKFPEFLEFSTSKKKSEKEVTSDDIETGGATTEELMEKGEEITKETLADELLDKLRTNSPDFFEKVVVDLLRKMGYGEGEVTGGSYDGGIDGIIYQDELGVDKIYLQAKRYKEGNRASPNDIKNFIASLDIKRANKGIFITTSKFVGNVVELCERSTKNIILIDGKRLAELMIKHNVGVAVKKNYTIKVIDENYFEE